MKLRLAGLVGRRKRRRRPREQAPKAIVPPVGATDGGFNVPDDPTGAPDKDPFDAARERLKREIPPPED